MRRKKEKATILRGKLMPETRIIQFHHQGNAHLNVLSWDVM